MRVRLCAAAVVLAVLALPAAAQASAPPAGFFGMDTAIVPTQQAFNQMHANGVEVFRLAIQWPEVEPRPPLKVGGYEFHRYNWKRPDEQMRELVSAGLRPHLSLIGSPYWVAPSYATTPMRSAAGRRGWPAFAAAVARRYGPGGTFWKLNPDLPVYTPGTYEIWNEENSQVAYAPKADPKEYAQLFKLAAKGILQADPRVRVMPGGMFGTPQREHSMYAWDFLGKFLKQPHMKAYVGGNSRPSLCQRPTRRQIPGGEDAQGGAAGRFRQPSAVHH